MILLRNIQAVIFFIMVAAVTSSLGAEPLSYSETEEKPKPRLQTPPRYPYEMRIAALESDVLVELVVDKNGNVCDASIINNTEPEFAAAALEALRNWEFKPARKGGQNVDVKIKFHLFFEIEFTLDGSKIFTLHQPPASEDIPTFTVGIVTPYTTMPAEKPLSLINDVKAVYPFPLLATGVTGKAKVRYIVGENGIVGYASILSASKPEFGEAALAMIRARRFQPPTNAGRPCVAVYDMSVLFKKNGPDITLNDNTWLLLEKEKQEGRKFASPGKLDAQLTPRVMVSPVDFRQPPTKPQTVVVECIIDQKGDVQLPRIVKADDQDCAYAALTAIAQWKFSPPMKNGQPVDARVEIPFDFH